MLLAETSVCDGPRELVLGEVDLVSGGPLESGVPLYQPDAARAIRIDRAYRK